MPRHPDGLKGHECTSGDGSSRQEAHGRDVSFGAIYIDIDGGGGTRLCTISGESVNSGSARWEGGVSWVK